MDEWTVIDRWDGSDGLLRVETQLLVLTREFRPGPWQVLDELPGGRVEPGEDILEAGTRELLEETGFAGAIELAGSCWVAAACRTKRHVAIVRHAVQVADPTPDQGELIETVLVELGEFRRRLPQGHSTNTACAYTALDHLGYLT